ncbi:hypothetical protein CP532_2162 [Ophiocordyceps camponoti-leonardi (nom. inval.)]|nr:hypothetical protein CP532_2162 [Ophiocordyceps camponoti-leonardi (nom. inval.)]
MDASAMGRSAIIGLVRSSSIILTTCFALAVAMVIFVTTRHAQLVRQRRAVRWSGTGSATAPAQRPGSYYLFVLGSGGHTKEMLMMMDDGFCDFVGFHRRYLLSSGDRVSRHQLEDYEARLASLCRTSGTSPGTYDARTVARARRVHQSLLTTPLTALASIIGIFIVLLSPPPVRARRLRYPTLVFSNGPATGFCVAFAIHLLKIFRVVPEDVMRFVYIESWARISTLSLTGRLLLRTGFADALYVQHEQVATKHGLPCAGEMVLNSRRPDE